MYAQSIMGAPLWLRWVALFVFIAAGITDFLDGYYARIWDQQSSLGKMLDPIADKLLVASCLLMLAADETIRGWSLWAAIVILCREILVSGLREYLGRRPHQRTGVAIGEVENHGATRGHRLPDRGRGGRNDPAADRSDRHYIVVDFGHSHHLHRDGITCAQESII